ncbi:MAG: hypothetical protein KBE65_12605 [Phycisphaerae bacterium]|nr:hypothetical protein [Phycisphaerae bacterium]
MDLDKMGIRSALNKQKLLRDFSRVPGCRPARTRTAGWLGKIKEMIPLKNLRPVPIRNLSLTALAQKLGWNIGRSKRTPRRCIGIDIGRLHVHAVQIARTPDGIQVEKGIGIQARRSTDSQAKVLHSLTHEHGFDPHADVAVALPHQTFFFADVETDPSQVEAIRAGDTTHLKDCFPIAAEDILSRVCSVLPGKAGKNVLLVAAVSCESLREQLSVLAEAGIRPTCIDTPTTAARAAILANHPQASKGLAVMLYVDESTLSLAVMRDGSILLVRSLPMLSDDNQDLLTLARQTADIVAQEIEITWQRLSGKAPEPGLRIFLIASHRMAESLASAIPEKIDSQVIPIDPYAGVKKAQAIEADFSLCVAEGLARRALQSRTSDSTDFLAAYQTRTRPALQPRRELAICGGLAVAAVVLWAVGLFVQLSSLESRLSNLKEQEVAIFQRVAPDEKTIVNPAAQLQQRLDALRQDGEMFASFNPGRPAPLEVLSLLSQQMPTKGTLKLEDTLITGDSVRIRGTCDSFATFFAWQQLLEKTPGLRLSGAPKPEEDPQSKKVRFTVSLSTAQRKAS